MLLVEDLMQTFLLLVEKGCTAQVIQNVEDGFVSVPKVIRSKNMQPELQNSYHTNTTNPGALQNMDLE